MPRGVYSNIRCYGSDDKKPFQPLKHQIDTMNFFLASPYKGLLLYHKLGSGKTCTSIMIADKMLEEGKVSHVYILTPGSLREGWVNEYCKICGTDPETLKTNYTFITYNYNVSGNLPSFENSLVIIDEVHNLINGVKNGAKTPIGIYSVLDKSNCRILALSGTPVYNYVWEFPILGKLLKPGEDNFPDIRTRNGLDSVAFTKWFNWVPNTGELVPVNPTLVRRRFEGIISYYPGAGEEYMPKIIEEEPIKVRMSEPQEMHYWEQYVREMSYSSPPKEELKYKDPKKYKLLSQLYIMAKKNILTRSAANFFYDKTVSEAIVNSSNHTDKLKDEGGWVSHELFGTGRMHLYSAKFVALITNIIANIHNKHVVFTFFKERSGVILLHSILKMCGITSAIFSGDLDDFKRRAVLKRYNSVKNRYGDKVKVLLVTEAGAEGISVLEARHMHILESSPRMGKITQAIGRVARYKSHINLPPEERNVRIWRYWSTASPEQIKITTKITQPDGKELEQTSVINNKICVDENLYKKGMLSLNEIHSFFKLLQSVSVTPF